MGGGAWPFLVGGMICPVHSVNERHLNLLDSSRLPVTISSGGSLVAKLKLKGIDGRAQPGVEHAAGFDLT